MSRAEQRLQPHWQWWPVRQLWLIVALATLLCSCAGLPTDGQRIVITDSTKPLGPPVEQFSISGRLLLKQGQRRDHLRFSWEHAAGRDTLLLSGALGQGVAKLTRDATMLPPARLELADGKQYVGTDWKTLAQQVFGQPLPLDALPQWLRGGHSQWAGDADKWRIVVTEASARPATAGRQHQLMPRLLQITSDDILLTIVVESWGDDDE